MNKKVTYKFSVCRTIATAGVSFLLAGTISASSDAMIYLHIPTIAFVFGICFFMLLGSYGADFIRFIPASLVCLAFSPLAPNPRYAEIAKFGSRYIIAGAVIAALIGFISVVRCYSDPYGLGGGLAVLMIGPFYAIVVSELFFAFVYKAFSDSGSPSAKKETPVLPASNLLIPLIVLGVMLGVFFALRQTYSVGF
ncbi:MAG: hypothetical protein HN350_20185 [Phycisphaerales bacterium]|jgi:hypothetical protein|nr:hypothetical protein [Phycisphaerales bacterium]